MSLALALVSTELAWCDYWLLVALPTYPLLLSSLTVYSLPSPVPLYAYDADLH